MFSLKHRILKTGVIRGKTDIHCHVLPGVDDGSPDFPHSLDLLDYMEHDLGLSAVWLTPHVMQGSGNTAARVQEPFASLTSRYEGAMRLHLSSEYMLDEGFDVKVDILLCEKGVRMTSEK